MVSVDAKSKVVLAGECKWSSRPASLETGKTLLKKVERLWPKQSKQMQLAIFAPKGFTKTLRKWATENNAWLVDASALTERGQDLGYA